MQLPMDSSRADDGREHESPSLPYSPQFARESWTHAGAEIDRFFDRFVPEQYEQGFAWRSRLVGQPERAIPFENHSEDIQKIIARNAEVLLQLFEETPVAELEQMRAAGDQFLTMNLQDQLQNEVELRELCESMGRRHHDRWLTEFRAALTEGRREDSDHPGNAEFADLPEKEIEIMQWQTYANWRILAGISTEDFDLLRELSRRREVALEAENLPAAKMEAPIILHVEDYEPFAKGIKEYFDARGYNVIWCSDPHSAAEIIQREDVAFAIIDGDIGDKNFSADGAAGQLILNEVVPADIPFIRVTGDPDQIVQDLQGAGVFDRSQTRLLSTLLAVVGEAVPISEPE